MVLLYTISVYLSIEKVNIFEKKVKKSY
jgi:hypothetical protein